VRIVAEYDSRVIPEHAQERWAAKIEELRQIRGDLALPYPSGTALAMAGRFPYPELMETVSGVASQYPDELPLDGGNARSKKIEKMLVQGGGARRVSSLAAAWMATDFALYFAVPNMNWVVRWEWTDATVRPVQQGRKLVRATVESLGETCDLELSTSAFTNLLAIQAWVKA
jgi:hypothetical protein